MAGIRARRGWLAAAAAVLVLALAGGGYLLLTRNSDANLSSASEAVGRSTQVTGTMQVAGDQVQAVKVEADLRGLQSDEGRRDNAIRQRGPAR